LTRSESVKQSTKFPDDLADPVRLAINAAFRLPWMADIA
jgi:hypothetical protein